METSGLVLFAKNPFILPILNRLLEKKEISREYWAQVDGHINSKELVFKDKIGRDRHDRRKRVVDTKNGQYAETHVSRLKQFPNKTSLVRCKLKTGRTHQIRVHLSHHNFPILGDPLYNSKSKTSRLMLHAFRLSFTHPLTLEKLNFTTLSDTFEKELKKEWMIASSIFKYLKSKTKRPCFYRLMNYLAIFAKYSRVRTSCAVYDISLSYHDTTLTNCLPSTSRTLV